MAQGMGQDMVASVPRMEPDTAPPHRGKFLLGYWSRAASAALLLIFLQGLPWLSGPGLVFAGEEEIELEESGIQYPGGFDPHTVGEIQGKAHAFSRPATGPVRFQLASERETYTVLTSPAWYWEDLKMNIPESTQVRVRGSKSLGKDGKLYIIAQEMSILPSGPSLAFRNEGGSPLWQGSRRDAWGSRRGQGSWGRGRTGAGSGGRSGGGHR